MRILDRYILGFFLKVFAMCFASLVGLYIVIDLFGNLDEFIGYGRKQGSLLIVLAEYYGVRSLSFFDMMSGVLTLIAAMFTLTWLSRTNELTALMAAGIPRWRVVVPIVAAVALISGLAVANREVLIPTFRSKLSRNAQDWMGDRPRSVQPIYDNETNILIRGQSTFADEQRIEKPSFNLPLALRHAGKQVAGESAFYRPPAVGRPGGYLFRNVTEPAGLTRRPSVTLGDRPVILSPHDTPWLAENECFVVSGVTFEQLSGGRVWHQLSSTAELVAALRNASLDFGPDVRVTVHARIVQPLLDLTLLFLGMPLVLSRQMRNVFFSGGLCLLLTAAFFLVILGSHSLGTQSMISPALAAWGPLIVFAPIAAALSRTLWE
jgi:lipopolysaccharide export system permease protein